MSKIHLNKILLFIMFVLILGVSTVFAYTYIASDVGFTSSDNEWKAPDVNTALDDLKNNCYFHEPVRVISGSIDTTGSIVKIKDEEFYIIGRGTGSESGKIKIFPKYTLKDYSQNSFEGDTLNFSNSLYWSNNVGSGNKYPGSYSGNPYPYVYDINSNLFLYIYEYANKLSSYGLWGITGRLITYEEASDLPKNIIKSVGANGYWFGSVYSNGNSVWFSDSIGGFWNGYLTDKFGIRPVLLIPEEEIW